MLADVVYAPSRGQMKSFTRTPTCNYADSKSGFNDMVGQIHTQPLSFLGGFYDGNQLPLY